MIESRNIHPQRNIYYLGAILIDVINSSPSEELGSISLFDNFCEREKISLETFILTFDWLFMLGLVENDNGEIKKCF